MNKLKLIKEAFLSDFNISVVFKQIQIEIKAQYNIKVGPKYLSYTQEMMHYLFSVYCKKFTKVHLEKGKKTVILMNAVTIKRVLSNIITFKPPPIQKPVKQESNVFNIPSTFIGSVKVDSLLYKDDYCVNIKDLMNSKNETHEWWNSQEKNNQEFEIQDDDNDYDNEFTRIQQEDECEIQDDDNDYDNEFTRIQQEDECEIQDDDNDYDNEFTRIQQEIDDDMSSFTKDSEVIEQEVVSRELLDSNFISNPEEEIVELQESKKVEEEVVQESKELEILDESVELPKETEKEVELPKETVVLNTNPFSKKNRKLKLLNI
jgi:hypothetical protein